LAKETGSELRIPGVLLEHLRVVKELQGTKGWSFSDVNPNESARIHAFLGDLTGVYGVVRTNSGLSFEN
jgi:hypothetical protein